MIIPLILCPLKDVHKYIQKHYENQSSKEEFSKNIEFIPYVFLQVKSIKFEKNIITCTLEEDLKTIKIFPKNLTTSFLAKRYTGCQPKRVRRRKPARLGL